MAAVVALTVLAIPMVIVALAIRLESAGPAIYRQTRIGQGGRPFTILKFRTMSVGSAGSPLTVPGDSRVTRFGRFLRATTIDELPQFLNVLRGDMTLVGPRPQTPSLAARYPASLAIVFDYRPGLTGPGVLLLNDDQVLHGTTSDPEAFYLASVVPARVALDMVYLEDPSVRRTIGLCLTTIRTAQLRFATQIPDRLRDRLHRRSRREELAEAVDVG